MKLNDLIEALAGEIEGAMPHLEEMLGRLATLDADADDFMDLLDQYGGQTQRMGEAAEMVGLPGLQAVCTHVQENILLLAALPVDERAGLLEFLRAVPPLLVHHLRHIADPSTAAGLVDHLVHAPHPLDEEQALKVMHLLGQMPARVQGAMADAEPPRPVLARPEDVALVMPVDVDARLLEGFFHEAPEQARNLVDLARKIASGCGTPPDLVVAKRVAHTLKGSGSIIGLRGLVSLGHHFEDILEHFERKGADVAPVAAEVLLDAAYCLEQMVAHVVGADEAPGQAQAVLQAVLDLANRIDRGESLGEPLARVAVAEPAAASAPASAPASASASAVAPSAAPPAAAEATSAPGAAMRVGVDKIDELFRVAGEISVHGAAMESRLEGLAARSRALLEQNLRLQKRLFELETLVDVRALTMMRARTRRANDAAFDPLEMDQYSELHSSAHALMEEAADARALALRFDEELAGLGGVHTRQQRLTKELQHLVVGTRMNEFASLESRLRRTVRSTAQSTGKLAELSIVGGATLVDGDVLGRLAEPLLHLLRNAVDHGLESPEQRLAAGKPASGRVELTVSRQGQQVVLCCSDDGRGLDLPAILRRATERGLIAPDRKPDDEETARLVLLPGFSTRDEASEISGRGVGLDVVNGWVLAMNGSIRIGTRPGQGSRFELRFAASLSTLQSLVVEVGGQRFALASIQVEQAVPRGVGHFERVGGRLAYRHGQRLLVAQRLCDLAGVSPESDDKPLDEHDVVIVRSGERTLALAVDRLVDARELLVKSPGRYARHVRGVAGLSILGDGGIAVNLDLAALLSAGIEATAPHAKSTPATDAREAARPGVLIVDDALSVRNALLQLLQDTGYRCRAARDGIEAIEALRSFKADLVLTDLEMPNMNGIELTTHLRGREDLKGLPVIMITSRSQDKHRRAAAQAGVDRYITKPYNDGDLLLAIREALAPVPA